VLIEIILLILIFEKHRYAKAGIFIWAIVGLIAGCGFGLTASLMDGFNNNFTPFKIGAMIYNLSGLAIGILIIDYTKRTVVIGYNQEDSNDLK
jgi:hypothetical protein